MRSYFFHDQAEAESIKQVLDSMGIPCEIQCNCVKYHNKEFCKYSTGPCRDGVHMESIDLYKPLMTIAKDIAKTQSGPDEMQPAYSLKNIEFPRCAVSCAAMEYLGVGECESVCPWKFASETGEDVMWVKKLDAGTIRLTNAQYNNLLYRFDIENMVTLRRHKSGDLRPLENWIMINETECLLCKEANVAHYCEGCVLPTHCTQIMRNMSDDDDYIDGYYMTKWGTEGVSFHERDRHQAEKFLGTMMEFLKSFEKG